MDRLTIKELHIVEDINKALDKLSQLEDIEEELGIDLITLFKAQEIYYRILYIDTQEYSEIKNCKKVHLDLQNKTLKVYEDFDEFGFDIELKDYGKTWALTKEELEGDN